ncbi:MAG: hypothetical protein DMF56_21240 [Acidobacteria bacterium]|nr:MAG: hypothetical protein DMF56_21240 [Acidobacteriota bacterium]
MRGRACFSERHCSRARAGGASPSNSAQPSRWICAVAKRVDDRDGFLITAYPTDAIKEGTRIWTK